MAEVREDLFIDIYNLATGNMKPKELKSFSEHYFHILESEDVDLDELLELSETDEDSEFYNHLSKYLEVPEEEEYEEEDY